MGAILMANMKYSPCLYEHHTHTISKNDTFKPIVLNYNAAAIQDNPALHIPSSSITLGDRAWGHCDYAH